MSEYKRRRQIWETRQFLHPRFHVKENVIKINVNNSLSHELAKFLACWELAKDGHRFVTEAIFNNGKRADILVLDDPKALEILYSESLDDFADKVSEYPVDAEALSSKQLIKLWFNEIKKAGGIKK